MRHILFGAADRCTVAILSKLTSFNKYEMERNYVTPLEGLGVNRDVLIGFSLKYNDKGKAPAALIKEYLEELLPELHGLGVEYLYCTDATYFKTLTKSPKAEAHIGYVLPCMIKGYEHFKVVLGINYQALIFKPELQQRLDLSLKTLADELQGTYQALGSNIIHSAYYPKSYEDIKAALASLHQYPELTTDIETFSLLIEDAGLGTMAFAWDQHNGLAFACDYDESAGLQTAPLHGVRFTNHGVRALVKDFLLAYKGRLTYHNCTFDVRTLIYTLWMQDGLDTEGLLEGLEALTNNIDDTKIIAYLATNSTAGNDLSLKTLAHEFAGNWAQSDIKDIRKIPLDKLLEYNLVDCLSTWYVKNKFTPIMVADRQAELYHTLMMPSQKVIIQIELSGMPMCADRVQVVKKELTTIENNLLDTIKNNPTVKLLNLIVQRNVQEKANAKLKTIQHPLSKYAGIEFNPNSGQQLALLLHDQMGLPVLDRTPTKQPATGGDTLAKLINHTDNPEYKVILEALIALSGVSKILSAFIPAFERAVQKGDDMVYLHGSFNLGGTVSGRLSSSKPNLQNLPAGSEWGKLIKSCFMAPKGWLMVGADFNSLEDYISALTTKDPNKLAVYLKGYDGHSLRAAHYFRDQLPDIDLDDPYSVNRLKREDHPLRQDSKAPTFLLTYGGTYHGMMKNLGWPEDKAKEIEKGYHSLYQVSDQWVAERIKQAAKDGYVEVAFGLRVRTPLLAQTTLGMKSTPYEAEAEGRTAGNALGQSYGLLNNRAAVEFMRKVWASEFRLDIKPIALIHDAIYLIVRDNSRVVEWVNRELILSMQWQELPELHHEQVKLGAALDIFWPHWGKPLTLPNAANKQTIKELCDKHKAVA